LLVRGRDEDMNEKDIDEKGLVYESMDEKDIYG